MKRIFIAIPIPQPLQEKILEWGNRHQNLPVRWLSGKNLHITLVPPWAVEEEHGLREIIEALKSVKLKPFSVSFDHITFGPDPKEPRLIWAAGKAPKDILDLRFKILDCLNQKSENKLFKLHITLARFRPEDFANFPEKNLNEKILWQENLNSFVAMESHLSPSGADYEILETFPLL